MEKNNLRVYRLTAGLVSDEYTQLGQGHQKTLPLSQDNASQVTSKAVVIMNKTGLKGKSGNLLESRRHSETIQIQGI